MAQNATNQDDESSATNESTKTTEDDLRKLKYGEEDVDGSDEDIQDETSEADESDEDAEVVGDDDGKTTDETADDDSEEDSDESSDDDDSEFVKEFPNIKGDTLVDYARNLESTISSSNKEGKRLADENLALKQRIAELESGKGTEKESVNESEDLSQESAYIRQKMDEEIEGAFSEFRKKYSQVEDATEYNKFLNEVRVLGQTIRTSQKRFPSASELYTKAAAILGWEPTNKVDDSDRLKVALKDRAATSKTTSSTKKAPKSKVTDAVLRANRKMYPGKSDEEIRKELEPYVQ